MRRFDNIHLGLSHEEALRILTLPLEQLESASDYYMAASHLINFPGPETEAALMQLLRNPSNEQSVNLARRKAVEVLARLDVSDAIGPIGDCLRSQDPFLVENSAWALQQLQCKDHSLHAAMVELLSDPTQNRRILIQSLSGLHVNSALPIITPLQDDENPGVRGAALAAVAKISGDHSNVAELENHLTLPNQMDRQSAIQDIIDCKATSLLESVLKAPVSPVFRMRALKKLWQSGEMHFEGLHLLQLLDRLMLDLPDDLILVHRYDEPPNDEFLIQELFGTDFSRCYLALLTLRDRSPEALWPLLLNRWEQDGHNDYGAHYFFVRLFGAIQSWPQKARTWMICRLVEAVDNQRPQFMKSKHAALLSLAALDPERCSDHLDRWQSPTHMKSWECRYAASMVINRLSGLEKLKVESGQYLKEESHPFVKQRLLQALS